MPSSPAKVAANQRNAQRSTGPTTVAGKAQSRLNALQHGMASSADLAIPGEDEALVTRRTAAFQVELHATGTLGAILTHRAARLSVRMERLANRDELVVAADVVAAREAFDQDRIDVLDARIADVDGTDPIGALIALEAMPEGVDYLRVFWRQVSTMLGDADRDRVQVAESRTLAWLGRPGLTSADCPALVAAEVTRLDLVAGSMLSQVHAIAAARRRAGLIASFDPSPEAMLIRRYEAAAERGFFRAIRELTLLRRDREATLAPDPSLMAPRTTPPPAPISTPVPIPQPTATPPREPVPAASVASFRVGVMPPVQATADWLAGASIPPEFPTPRPKKRRDVRKLTKNRR